MSNEKCAEENYELNILLIGDGGVGKTSLIKKILTDKFNEKYEPTIGVKISEIVFDTNRGDISAQIWDTAGQEKFGPLRENYYKKADMIILMFDVTSRITYKNIPNWYTNINKIKPDIPCVLVGNKVDLKNYWLSGFNE